MNREELNPNMIDDSLDRLFERLRQEVNRAVSINIAAVPGEDLDRYLLEINRFYYQSFHRELFPVYKSALQDELTGLLAISRQQDMIYQDIMAGLKRYAQLYNQVKKVCSMLALWREQYNRELLAVSREQVHYALELHYSLKKARAGLDGLITVVGALTSIIKRGEVMDMIIDQAIDLQVIKFLSTLDPDDAEVSTACNRLSLYFSYLSQLLDPQKRGFNMEQTGMALKELEKQQQEFLTDRRTRPLHKPYRLYLQASISRFSQLLSLYLQSVNPSDCEKTAGDFTAWLNQCRIMLEWLMTWPPEQRSCLLPLIFSVKKPELRWLEALSKDSLNVAAASDRLMNDLDSSSEPDFAYFSANALQAAEDVLSLVRKATAETALIAIPGLTSGLRQVELEYSALLENLELLNQKNQHSDKMLAQYLQGINMTDAYLNLLGNIRSDLERLLAPRNIARVWKGIPIRVDRIPLEKGCEFPSEYLYLLDKFRVETRIVEDSPFPHMILHEEGDLFIIRVQDQVEEEVPYLIIAERS